MDKLPTPVFLGIPCGLAGKESPCNVGDLGSIPVWEGPLEEGTATQIQYSGMENSMDYISLGLQRVGHNWATFTIFRILSFKSNNYPLLSSLFASTFCLFAWLFFNMSFLLTYSYFLLIFKNYFSCAYYLKMNTNAYKHQVFWFSFYDDRGK